jgi:predicted phosphodiesterase
MGTTESKLTADDDSWIDRLLQSADAAAELTRLERTISNNREQLGLVVRHLQARADRAQIVGRLVQLDAQRRGAFLLPLLMHVDSDAVFAAIFSADRADLLAVFDLNEMRVSTKERSELVVNAIGANAIACATLLLRSAPLRLSHAALVLVLERAPHLLEAISEPPLYAVDFESEHRNTLLHTMAMRGERDAVAALLQRGVSPTATTTTGETPLFAAVRARYVDTTLMLIRARDGVLVRNVDGLSALDVADADGAQSATLAAAFRAEIAVWPEAQRAAVLHFFANGPPHQTPLRIQVCSDLHVEFSDNVTRFDDVLATDAQCHLLALLGDIGVVTKPSYRSFVQSCADKGHFEKVFVVLGNHEYYRGDMLLSLREAADVCSSRGDVLTLLHRASTVVTVGARRVRLIGSTLWSHVPPNAALRVSMSLNDYRQISNKIAHRVGQLTMDNLQTIDTQTTVESQAQRAEREAYIAQAHADMGEYFRRDDLSLLTVLNTNAVHAADLAFFNAECRAARDAGEDCVILCHHAPLMRHGVGSPEYWFDDNESAFGTDLRESLIDPNPNLRAIVYGHTHWPQDFTLVSANGATCRVVSNPRGYNTEKRSRLFKKSYVLEL